MDCFFQSMPHSVCMLCGTLTRSDSHRPLCPACKACSKPCRGASGVLCSVSLALIPPAHSWIILLSLLAMPRDGSGKDLAKEGQHLQEHRAPHNKHRSHDWPQSSSIHLHTSTGRVTISMIVSIGEALDTGPLHRHVVQAATLAHSPPQQRRACPQHPARAGNVHVR